MAQPNMSSRLLTRMTRPPASALPPPMRCGSVIIFTCDAAASCRNCNYNPAFV